MAKGLRKGLRKVFSPPPPGLVSGSDSEPEPEDSEVDEVFSDVSGEEVVDPRAGSDVEGEDLGDDVSEEEDEEEGDDVEVVSDNGDEEEVVGGEGEGDDDVEDLGGSEEDEADAAADAEEGASVLDDNVHASGLSGYSEGGQDNLSQVSGEADPEGEGHLSVEVGGSEDEGLEAQVDKASPRSGVSEDYMEFSVGGDDEAEEEATEGGLTEEEEGEEDKILASLTSLTVLDLNNRCRSVGASIKGSKIDRARRVLEKMKTGAADKPRVLTLKELRSMKTQELRKVCADLGLKYRGTKAENVTRIAEKVGAE